MAEVKTTTLTTTSEMEETTTTIKHNNGVSNVDGRVLIDDDGDNDDVVVINYLTHKKLMEFPFGFHSPRFSRFRETAIPGKLPSDDEKSSLSSF